MAVTERSYAYYHVQYAKAAGKAFHVVPTTADQLYLGYKAELATPNVAAAAYATRGQLITYQGAPVVTPYFSHSDGRTRSWSEVWGGGAKAWLVSVPTVYDEGRSMLGHGVGMSGLDASLHASKDGWKYDQILGYYYSGTKVERVY
jgi:SpoIID/LytB domain protein